MNGGLSTQANHGMVNGVAPDPQSPEEFPLRRSNGITVLHAPTPRRQSGLPNRHAHESHSGRLIGSQPQTQLNFAHNIFQRGATSVKTTRLINESPPCSPKTTQPSLKISGGQVTELNEDDLTQDLIAMDDDLTKLCESTSTGSAPSAKKYSLQSSIQALRRQNSDATGSPDRATRRYLRMGSKSGLHRQQRIDEEQSAEEWGDFQSSARPGDGRATEPASKMGYNDGPRDVWKDGEAFWQDENAPRQSPSPDRRHHAGICSETRPLSVNSTPRSLYDQAGFLQ